MNKTFIPVLVGMGAVLALLVGGATAYLMPHIPLVWQISLGLALVLFITYIAMERSFLAQTLSKRTTQYGLNSILMSIIALVIVVVVNLIGTEHDLKKDFTKNKTHTLSDQSVKVLQGLKQEVRFRAFASPDQIANFEKIFGKYNYHTKNLKTDFIDVDKEPMAVQKYGIKQAGTIIVESEARSVKVDNIFGPDDPKVEEKLTNAIIQVAKGDKKKIYFISGHGERLISDTSKEAGYSEIKEALESGRYKVEEMTLLDKEKLPADAEIVIIPGPKSDFMEHELKMLEAYVKGGGKLLVMMEPDSTTTLKPFLEKFGADWKNGDTVLETNPLQKLAGGNPLTPIVVSYDTTNEITQEAKQPSIYPVATPIEKAAAAPNGYKVTSLFSTSSRSFQIPLKSLEKMKDGRIELDEKKNKKGPLSLALAISGKVEGAPPPPKPDEKKADDKDKKEEKKEPEFRMVVVGDSDFATNGAKRFGINADIFQNMLSWLAHEEDLISIRPRPADESQFEITEERARIITLASVAVAPFGMFLAGIFVWWMRRRR